MRRIILYTSDFKLVTDRVEIQGILGAPSLVKYGERFFTHIGGNRYIETLPIIAIDFPNLTQKLFKED